MNTSVKAMDDYMAYAEKVNEKLTDNHVLTEITKRMRDIRARLDELEREKMILLKELEEISEKAEKIRQNKPSIYQMIKLERQKEKELKDQEYKNAAKKE